MSTYRDTYAQVIADHFGEDEPLKRADPLDMVAANLAASLAEQMLALRAAGSEIAQQVTRSGGGYAEIEPLAAGSALRRYEAATALARELSKQLSALADIRGQARVRGR